MCDVMHKSFSMPIEYSFTNYSKILAENLSNILVNLQTIIDKNVWDEPRKQHFLL